MKKKRLIFIIFYTLFAIIINFLGSLVASKIIFHLYLDSVLTISVVALCGLVPGLLCAFVSNLILSFVTHTHLLFSLCHLSTAFFAYLIFCYEEKKFAKNHLSYTEKQNFNSYSIDAFLWAGMLSFASNTIFGNLIANIAFDSSPPLAQANIIIQGFYIAFENLTFANNLQGFIENLVDKLLSSILSFASYRVCVRWNFPTSQFYTSPSR